MLFGFQNVIKQPACLEVQRSFSRFAERIDTWKVGNILLPALVTIISVPNWWNSSQSGFASRAAPAPTRAGWRGLLEQISSDEFAPFSAGWWSPWWRLLLLLSLLRDSTTADEEETGVEFVGWAANDALDRFGLRDRFTLPADCKHAK